MKIDRFPDVLLQFGSSKMYVTTAKAANDRSFRLHG